MIPRWLDDELRMLLRARAAVRSKLLAPKTAAAQATVRARLGGHAGRHYGAGAKIGRDEYRGAPLQSKSTILSDPHTFLAKAGQGHSISEYGAGDVVFAQGDQAAEVFFVEQGRVKITVVSGRGKEAVVGILATGHFLGEAVLTGQQVRVSTATVLEKSKLPGF